MNKIENYGINDIESLSFCDGVRKRIQMYLGSNDMQGVYNAIQEIISNSIDEFYMGYGNTIEIGLNEETNMITITDYGRGIPFGIKEDGSNVLVDIFSKPHTGGKFNDKVYNSVAGLNGIGAKATCLSSEKFAVSVVRNGKHAKAIFEKGNLISYNEEDWKDKNASGTSIQFIPDAEVYNLEPIKIDFNVLCEKCKNLSYLTKGLTFVLESNNEKVTYCADKGILNLIEDKVKNPVHNNPLYYEIKEDDKTVEVAMQWTKDKEKSFIFTNGLYNIEGGTPLTGLKTAITRFIKKNVNEEIDGEMARTGLVCAISCKISNPSYANQTKTKINNPELNGLTQRAVGEMLNIFSTKNKEEFKQVSNFLLKERKAEIAAEKARAAVLESQKVINKESKKKSVLAGKLVDCESHGEDSQLFVVEGISALGAIVKSRDGKHTAVYPLRGKLINVLKNPAEDIMKNQEIQELQVALGCGIGENYNEKKLRYGRVAIAADMD